tara:strand:- start:52951 stop:53688 length:738 start_codon:yes stop_codon:yes gene_type:complete
MIIHKISATTSTNNYVKDLLKNNNLSQDIAVWAKNQTKGKGQMGSQWYSKEGESLTFSVYKRFYDFKVGHQFYISIAASLAIKKVLEDYGIQNITVKWPNDIMSADKKICGILIENILKEKNIKGSIIGIGLNVNESSFENLPGATSMKIVSGKEFAIEGIFEALLGSINLLFQELKPNDFQKLKSNYLNCMYRKDRVSVFETSDKKVFNGIIRGVSESGKLEVEIEDASKVLFDLKEIKMLNGL